MEYLIGALGAILDETKKASEELITVLDKASVNDFVKIVDRKSDDEDCRSIQTICRHVIRSGYGYANYVLNALGITKEFPKADEMKLETADDASTEIRKMVKYNIHNLYELNREKIEANMSSIRFTTRWNEDYGFEQILEHGVVHILRHRRQIEKFIRLIRKSQTI